MNMTMRMNLRRTLVIIAPTLLIGAASVGCKSELTGNEGNLLFSYTADDAITDFNKPIAVGARLDLEVREAGTRKSVTIGQASSDKPEVLDVAGISGNTIVLEGKADGNVLVSVDATLQSGTAVSDSVNMNVRTPEILELRHSCEVQTAAAAHYLISDVFWLQYDMKLSNGQPVIGYGYHPITIEPADSVTIDANARDQQWFHFTTGATAQNVTLSNSIDSTTLTLELVEVGSVDGGMLQLDSLLPAEVGKKRALYVLPTANGRPICQAQTDYSVVTDSPEVCTVTAIVAPDTADLGVAKEFGWLEVEGLTAGTCNFTVTYTEGAAGVGASSALAVPVNP